MESQIAEKSTKKQFIKRMFEDISDRYDFLNRVISFGLDGVFRKRATLPHKGDSLVLDICAGTGDMARALLESDGFTGTVVLADLSPRMLRIAIDKLRRVESRNDGAALFVIADADHLPFKPAVFDGVISGFSLRNLSRLENFALELNYVLRSGGQATLLDVAHPQRKLYARLFHIYFYKIIPLLSRLFTRKKYAYKYLPASLRVFYPQPEVLRRLSQGGLEGDYEDLLGGIAAIYRLGKR